MLKPVQISPFYCYKHKVLFKW